MTTFQIGQTVEWQLQVTSDGTTAADLGGGNPTASVTLPDGTTVAATVTRISAGLYLAAVTSTQAGRHRVTWAGSGANSGQANGYTDTADVWPADPRFIISLADARTALNLPATARSNDDELRLYVASATSLIEEIVGAVLPESRTEVHDGGRSSLALHQFPTAITSVVEGGVTLTAADYCLSVAGLLYRGSYPGAGVWRFGASNVTVTMTVGAAIVPTNILVAARELVKFQYQISQQASRPSFGAAVGDGGDISYSPRFAVPDAVLEKLKPSMSGRVPGFA